MSRPKTYKTEAIVLKQTPLREADRILTMFTLAEGKVRAVAKGVRRTKSRLGGHLELLNRVSVSIAIGRELDIVGEAETVQSFRAFKEDLGRLSMGLYVAELVDGFTIEHSASGEVYGLLLETLDWLGKAAAPELLLRSFEMRLLDVSGYRPELVYCVECRAPLQPGGHAFSSILGGVLCPDCRRSNDDALIPISLNAMKVLRYIQREPRYDAVDALTVPPPLLGEAERLLRTYIRAIFQREWKSAEFMNLVKSLSTLG